ncbi:MAG: isoprenyl transferase [bacterium]
MARLSDAELQRQLRESGEIPNHIAIIMDGNGRWARQRALPRLAGHREGIKSVRDIVAACGELDVKVLTLYTFSRENWRRPRQEVAALMRLLLRTIEREVSDLAAKNVQLRTIGRLDDLPEQPRKALQKAKERTSDNSGLILNLALSYSGRQEILDAVAAYVREPVQPLTEERFARHLYTAGLPDPDLLIRTSGEMRISNFLLWQLAYTELYITDVLWPDFRRRELYRAIEAYQRRERRYGLLRR